MANRVYRFRQTKPTIDDAKLSAEVGFAVTLVSSSAGGAVMDVTTDEARAQDLKDAMAARGFVFVEQDPATTTRNEYGTSLGTAFVKETIESDLVIPADQVFVSHRMRVDDGKEVRIELGGELKLI